MNCHCRPSKIAAHNLRHFYSVCRPLPWDCDESSLEGTLYTLLLACAHASEQVVYAYRNP